jgi:uncharacterized membrane protein
LANPKTFDVLKNYVNAGSRIILIGLGVVFVFSGVEHLSHPSSFTEHYNQSGIGKFGSWIIGALQIAAGTSLVFWKQRHWVSFGVAVVMFAAMMNHVRMASPSFPWMAFCIFVLSALPAFGLFKARNNY